MSKKTIGSLELVGYYVGKVMIGLGLIQLLPLITSLAYAEWDIVTTFMISCAISLLFGGALVVSCKDVKSRKLNWGQGMTVTALSWFVGMLLAALPYYLSGNYLSYLDCCFDVMSGFTTTGLVLIQDLDHVANGINMWRHLLTFVGGQGMVVLALSFLVKGTNGAYKMYVGEGKDEQLMPNVVSTARAIWVISLVYLAFGTLALTINGICIGMRWDRSFLHGLWVFMAGWSTGGFAPQTQNILYYHSLSYELVTMVFFIIGSFNFALHYAVITSKKRELIKNIETQSFLITVLVLTILTTVGLMKLNIYPDFMAVFRKGFYQLISGHTTTGFMTVYAKQFYTDWGELALVAITISMLIGGSACSTAGGFKGLRVGIIVKSFFKEIKRMILPESMVVVRKFHHVKDVILEDSIVKSAMLIVILYIITFLLGTLSGMLCGYSFAESAFESASVTGNVGLSIGLTQAGMPSFLKIVYIVIMWLARLEFVSVFALAASIFVGVKKRCVR